MLLPKNVHIWIVCEIEWDVTFRAQWMLSVLHWVGYLQEGMPFLISKAIYYC